MKLAIKRFIAKKRLETAFDILSYYENKRNIITRLEHPYILIGRLQVGWVLKHWKKKGMV